jgi:hypothetical protein
MGAYQQRDGTEAVLVEVQAQGFYLLRLSLQTKFTKAPLLSQFAHPTWKVAMLGPAESESFNSCGDTL